MFAVRLYRVDCVRGARWRKSRSGAALAYPAQRAFPCSLSRGRRADGATHRRHGRAHPHATQPVLRLAAGGTGGHRDIRSRGFLQRLRELLSRQPHDHLRDAARRSLRSGGSRRLARYLVDPRVHAHSAPRQRNTRSRFSAEYFRPQYPVVSERPAAHLADRGARHLARNRPRARHRPWPEQLQRDADAPGSGQWPEAGAPDQSGHRHLAGRNHAVSVWRRILQFCRRSAGRRKNQAAGGQLQQQSCSIPHQRQHPTGIGRQSHRAMAALRAVPEGAARHASRRHPARGRGGR